MIILTIINFSFTLAILFIVIFVIIKIVKVYKRGDINSILPGQTNKVLNEVKMKIQPQKIGIFLAILAIACIIIAQTADFHYTKKEWIPSHYYLDYKYDGYYETHDYYNKTLKDGLLYGGIAALIVGAGIAVFANSDQNK